MILTEEVQKLRQQNRERTKDCFAIRYGFEFDDRLLERSGSIRQLYLEEENWIASLSHPHLRRRVRDGIIWIGQNTDKEQAREK